MHNADSVSAVKLFEVFKLNLVAETVNILCIW